MKQFLLLLSVLIIFGCNQNQKKESLQNEKVITEPNGDPENATISPAVAFAKTLKPHTTNKPGKLKRQFHLTLTFPLAVNSV